MNYLKNLISELKFVINKYDTIINNNNVDDDDDDETLSKTQDSFIEDINPYDEKVLDNTNSSNLKLYFFYNPSCPACKQVFPSWNKLIDLLDNYNDNIFDIYNVDVSVDNKVNSKLLNNYKVRYVPTFIGHNKITDKIIIREGSIQYKDLINFIKEFYSTNQ